MVVSKVAATAPDGVEKQYYGKCFSFTSIPYMQVIFHAIDPVEKAVFVSYNPYQIGIKFSGMFRNKSISTVLCTENQMI
jgi:hypothetical protein